MARTTMQQDREFSEALKKNLSTHIGEDGDCSWVVDFVADHFSPEEVHGTDMLDEWATDNGYTKT